jgi:hypothetical protein
MHRLLGARRREERLRPKASRIRTTTPTARESASLSPPFLTSLGAHKARVRFEKTAAVLNSQQSTKVV